MTHGPLYCSKHSDPSFIQDLPSSECQLLFKPGFYMDKYLEVIKFITILLYIQGVIISSKYS